MQRLIAGKNHYSVLGLTPGCDKAAIKSAYYKLVKVFHPDRAHIAGVQGEVRELQIIVTALTEAYETLSRQSSRRAYDVYLGNRQTTLGARNSMPPRAPSNYPPGSSTRPPRSSVRPSGAPPRSSPRASFRPPRVPQDLLDTSAGQPPPVTTTENRFVTMMETAAQNKEWASAVNMAKLALEMTPNDPRLSKRLEELQFEADRALAEKFISQGRYEEESREYARAARSFERAANGRKSGELYARAAQCLLRDGTQPRKVVELARQAQLLNKNSTDARMLLARAYAAGGMGESAHQEAKRALAMDPKNKELKAFVKEMKG